MSLQCYFQAANCYLDFAKTTLSLLLLALLNSKYARVVVIVGPYFMNTVILLKHLLCRCHRFLSHCM